MSQMGQTEKNSHGAKRVGSALELVTLAHLALGFPQHPCTTWNVRLSR
jgi:hypothetical protein